MRGTIDTCRRCGHTIARDADSDWKWFHTRDGSWACE